MASVLSNDTDLSQPGSPSGEKSDPSSPLDHASLLQAVRKQVEYYFSKENLQSDTFLMSHMDASNSVPITVVMKFSKMKSLVNGDEALLREALRDSQVCVITEEGRIRALNKAGGRSTIILREIPADTPEALVREIFNFEGCKRIASLRSDIENTWFVEMDSETDAKDTLLDLKMKRRQFNGEAVKARLKTEVAVRSFYSQPPPSLPMNVGSMRGFPVVPAMGMSPIPVVPYGYVPAQVNVNGALAGPGGNVFGYGMQPVDLSLIPGTAQLALNGGGAPRQGGRPTPSYEMWNDDASNKDKFKDSMNNQMDGKASSAMGKTQRGKGTDNFDRSGGRVGPSQGIAGNAGINKNGAMNAAYPTNGGRQASGSKTGVVGSPNGGRGIDARTNNGSTATKASKGAKGQQIKGSSGGAAPMQPVDLNLQNFPPLHVDESSVPAAGYQTKYQRYTAEEIIAIVSQVRDAPIPAGIDGRPLNPADHPHAMTATPNMDLLKRQRSFSIDETREQLQQGKPVQREAVMSGAVDYASMIYGDPRSGSVDMTEHTTSSLQPAIPTGTVPRDTSVASGNRSRSNSDNFQTKVSITQSSITGKTSVNSNQQPRGVNAVPSASSWAQLVKSSAVVSTQTEPVKTPAPRSTVVATAGVASAPKSNNSISNNSANDKGTSAGRGAEAPASKTETPNTNTKESSGKARSHRKKEAQPKVSLLILF